MSLTKSVPLAARRFRVMSAAIKDYAKYIGGDVIDVLLRTGAHMYLSDREIINLAKKLERGKP